jgi:hypothetical protein
VEIQVMRQRINVESIAFGWLVIGCFLQCGCDAFKDPKAKAQAAAKPAVEQAPPEMEKVKADVGVGKKGASLRGENQLIAGPAVAYFNTREKVVFQIQIPHALDLFNAEHGFYPKSHEEFMEKIVEFNQIKLPQLPDGAKYVYDVDSHTLMVERPAKTETPE